MAGITLHRLKIHQDIIKKLDHRNITTIKCLFNRTKLDLVQTLDLPIWEVDTIYDVASAFSYLSFQTSLKMFNMRKTNALYFLDDKIECKNDHSVLINEKKKLKLSHQFFAPSANITEIVGASGVGKTQMCLTACARTVLRDINPSPHVLYIDTESTFNISRVIEIANTIINTKDPQHIKFVDKSSVLASRITIYKETRSLSILTLLEKFESIIIEKNAVLIIVDSIAAPVRRDFDLGSLPQRQLLLARIASRLKYLSETFCIPIIVTNQVTPIRTQNPTLSLYNDNIISAALGLVWAHSVNIRYILEQSTNDCTFEGTGHIRRRLSVVKSPMSSLESLLVCITQAGIEYS